MATIICASLEAATNSLPHSLPQSSFLRPCEPTSSSLAALSSWKSKSLGVVWNEGHSQVANARSRGFGVATRATVTAYTDVDSVIPSISSLA